MKTAAAYIVVLVLPIVWAPVVLLVRDPKKWAPRIFTRDVLAYLLEPEYSPWDRLFNDVREHWIRIRLKSGAYVGGVLAQGSMASSYPSPEQIYIQSEWRLDPDSGAFTSRVANAGLLVNGTEIEYLELIEGVQET